MRSRSRYLDQGQCSWIRDWWRAMQPATTEGKDVPFALRALGRGDRAKCKRCTTLEELEQELAPNLLAAHFAEPAPAQEAWLQKWMQGHYEALFLLAGVLAHVKEDAKDSHPRAGKSLVFVWAMPNSSLVILR
jgi:CRISPR system Cascade subunit CasB